MGTIVRIPLSGRRVRGYVVQVVPDREGELKEISAVSGSAPIFDTALLRSLEWAAAHYIAPMAVLLERSAPPNLPRSVGNVATTRLPETMFDDPMSEIIDRILDGARSPVTGMVGAWRSLSWVMTLSSLLASGKSALLIAATAAEVDEITGKVKPTLGDRLVSVTGDNAQELTAAWESAQTPGKLVVGTPRTSTWPVKGLSLAVVLEEGRRAMKDRQTPTIHVREMVATRARSEGFGLVFIGPTPSLEILSRGARIVRLPGRPWGLVEVVDRTEDAPGSGFLSDRVVAALRATAAGGRRCFIFTHRRADASSMRCTRCRRVRRCGNCGSRLSRSESCPRCGERTGPCRHCGGTEFEEMGTVPDRIVSEVNQKVGSEIAHAHPTHLPVSVGTERDIAGLAPVDLVVAVDADGLLLGHNYRTSEEALRVLARLGNALNPGSGRRMMVQTSMPDSELLVALKRGDPMPYLEDLLVERARMGLPPASEMIALEIRGDSLSPALDEQVKGLEGSQVMGPAHLDGGQRWLLMGRLASARSALPGLIQAWRDSGLTVRVDADPIDL